MKHVFILLFIVLVSVFLLAGDYTSNGLLVLKQDKETEAITMIEYEHHEIHSGSSFMVTYFDADVDSTETSDILLVTPNTTKWGHLIWEISGTLVTTVYIYEAATTSADGTGLTEVNQDRNSSTAATIVATHTPSVTSAGTEIYSKSFGTSSGPNAKSGGLSHADMEIILKQNTKYLIRVDSDTDNNRISFVLRWYEHTNK